MKKEYKLLIENVVNNEFNYAKQDIRNILEASNSETDKWWRAEMLRKLDTSFIQQGVPEYLKGILTIEDCSNFSVNRYLLTDREKKLFDNIVQARRVNSKLASMGIRYTNSSLLHGPSGTGKTTFGRYLAYELGLPFCYLNFAKTISSKLGQTADNIFMAFQYVLQEKNVVLLLDEIDAIGGKRGNREEGSVAGEMGRITITLMQCLDRIDNDTVILGATNRKDILDEALIRRFTQIHEVKELSDEESEKLAKMFLSDTGIDFNDDNVNDIVLNTSHKQSDIVNSCIELIIEKLEKEDVGTSE